MSKDTFDWLLYVVEYGQRKRKIEHEHMFENEIRRGKLSLLRQERHALHMQMFGVAEKRHR